MAEELAGDLAGDGPMRGGEIEPGEAFASGRDARGDAVAAGLPLHEIAVPGVGEGQLLGIVESGGDVAGFGVGEPDTDGLVGPVAEVVDDSGEDGAGVDVVEAVVEIVGFRVLAPVAPGAAVEAGELGEDRGGRDLCVEEVLGLGSVPAADAVFGEGFDGFGGEECRGEGEGEEEWGGAHGFREDSGAGEDPTRVELVRR